MRHLGEWDNAQGRPGNVWRLTIVATAQVKNRAADSRASQGRDEIKLFCFFMSISFFNIIVIRYTLPLIILCYGGIADVNLSSDTRSAVKTNHVMKWGSNRQLLA